VTVVMTGQMYLDDWDEKSDKKNDQDDIITHHVL